MAIGFYEKALGKNFPVEVMFSRMDKAASMFVGDDAGVTLVLPLDDAYFENKKERQDKNFSRFMESKVKLNVKSIDVKNEIVVLSYQDYMKKSRTEGQKKIEEKLAKKEKVVVDAIVTGVNGKGVESCAYIVVPELNIHGIIKCQHWSTVFTVDINDVAKKGMKIKVSLIRKIGERKNTGVVEYLCSRAAALDDPWKGIETKLHKGDVVNVLVQEAFNGGFSGIIPGILDIKAYVVKPKDTPRVVPGLLYQGQIVSVSEKNKSLRIYPNHLCFIK